MLPPFGGSKNLSDNMALTEYLPVYKDTYKLIQMVFAFTKDFPREYKYSLGQDMKRDAIRLVRSIYRANRSESKKEWLEDFLDDFEVLKLELRLCVDLQLLTLRRQSEISPLLESIGRQVTAWKNAGTRRPKE